MLYRLQAVLALGILVGCASNGITTQPSANMQIEHQTLTTHSSAGSNLYVADKQSNAVLVYSPSTRRIIRRITAGVVGPTALAFDPTGNLYVLNSDGETVTEYATGGTALLRTIGNGSVPSAIAVDNAGNLYVAYDTAIDVFAPGATTPSRAITNGVHGPAALVFDSTGHLYAANDNDVIAVYNSGSSSPSQTITRGIDGPRFLAIGSSRLYVYNAKNESVGVYDAESYGRVEAITSGLKGSISMTLDGSDNLYVGNVFPYEHYTVTEYQSDSASPIRTLSRGIKSPFSLATDSSGNLYVGEGDYIKLFAPGQTVQYAKIHHGIHEAAALAFGP